MPSIIQVPAKVDDVLLAAAEIDCRRDMQDAHYSNSLQRACPNIKKWHASKRKRAVKCFSVRKN
jgi:hypothetical protein